jgi:hypothetical protein
MEVTKFHEYLEIHPHKWDSSTYNNLPGRTNLSLKNSSKAMFSNNPLR